jgi:hypothetical protein
MCCQVLGPVHRRASRSVRALSITLALGAGWAAASCREAATGSDPVVAPTKPPSAPAKVTADAPAPTGAPAPEGAPPSPVLLPNAYPGNEEDGKLSLSWRTSSPGQLRRGPGREQPLVASVRLRSKERLVVKGTAVLITKPRPIVAKRKETIPATPYQSDPHDNPSPWSDLEIPAGQTYYYYHYLGEGDCLLAFEGKLYYASCAASDTVPTNATAQVQQWWVEIQKGKSRGWIEVNDQLVRKRVSW